MVNNVDKDSTDVTNSWSVTNRRATIQTIADCVYFSRDSLLQFVLHALEKNFASTSCNVSAFYFGKLSRRMSLSKSRHSDRKCHNYTASAVVFDSKHSSRSVDIMQPW